MKKKHHKVANRFVKRNLKRNRGFVNGYLFTANVDINDSFIRVIKKPKKVPLIRRIGRSKNFL